MIVEGLSVPRALVAGRQGEWPFTVPAIAAVVENGLRFAQPVTFLVGENGSGKSTLIEAIAGAYGADVRGGHIGRTYASTADKPPLADVLRLELGAGRPGGRKAKGFFLRAETAYGVFEFMSDEGVPGYGDLHLLEVSHGESFLQVFGDKYFTEPGLVLLDEPEAALSFTSSLSLLATLHDLVATGAQIICATHSPLLASLPGATILELGDHGLREVEWGDLDLVRNWRAYLDDPPSFLRHLLD